MANETVVRVTADASGYVSELDKAKRSAQAFITSQDDAAKRTQAAQAAVTEAISNGSDASVRKINAFMQSLTRQAETAGKTRAELLQMQAATLGISGSAQQYIDKIAAATAGTHGFSLSSAGARRELLVLGHEIMTGNWTRFGGSITVLAQRANAMSLIFNKTTLTIAAFVAVVGIATHAAISAAEQMAAYGDQVEKLSQKTGLSTTSIQQWSFAAKAVGVDTKDATKALSDLGDAQNKALQGNKDSVAAFKAIGISLDDLKKKSPDQLLSTIADAFSSAADGASKAAVANELFGASGENLIPLLDRGAAGLAELKAQADASGAVIDDKLVKQMAALNEQMEMSKAKMEAASMSAKTVLLPTIINLTDAMSDNVAMKPIMEDFYKGVGIILKTLASAIATVVVGFEGISEAITTNASVVYLVLRGEFKAAVEAAKIGYQNLKTEGQGYAQFMQHLWSNTTTAPPTSSSSGTTAKRTITYARGHNSQKTYHDDAAARFIQSLRDQDAAIRAELSNSNKLTEAEKQQAEFLQKIADLKEKRVLTADEKSLLANQDIIKAQLAQNVADEQALKLKQDIQKVTERSAQLNAQMASYQQSQQDQYQRQLDAFGMGKEAQQRANAVRSIYKEYQRMQAELDKATPKELLGGDDYNAESRKIQQGLQKSLADYDNYYAELKKKQGDWTVGASEAFANYQDNAQNVAAQVSNAFSDGFKSMEDAIATFLRTGKLSFSGFAQSVIADLARIEAKAIESKILGSMSSSGGLFATIAQIGLSLSGGGTAQAAQIASAMPGDALDNFLNIYPGKAAGGQVMPGSLQPVNELGPELLTVSGKDYLMMGAQGGFVTPNSQLGGQAIHLTSYPTIHIDARSDQAQVRALVMQGVQQGNAQLVDQLRRARKI